LKERTRHLAAALTGLGLGLAALGPGLAPGFVLSYDLVFVPGPACTDLTFGLTGIVPRHVPSDAFATALAHVLPADAVQKLVLLAVFVMACTSAASLVPSRRLLPRLTAGVCYAWNPFVAERLLHGQWALLHGYAALPWAVAAAARTDEPGGTRRLVRALLPAAIGGFAALTVTGITALTVALTTGGGRQSPPADHSPPAEHKRPVGRGPAGEHRPAGGGGDRGRAAPDAGRPVSGRPRIRARLAGTARVLAAVGVLSLPWLVPGVLRPAGLPQDGVAVDLFAARADTPFGTLGSLLLLGGVWNGETVPSGYGAPVTAAIWLLVVVIALFAYWRQGSGGVDPGAFVAAAGVGVRCLFGAVAFGDEVGDLVGEDGDLPGGQALPGQVEEDLFGGGAVAVVQPDDRGGDGGGVSVGQVACGEAACDLGKAAALAGEVEALAGAGFAHAQPGAQPRQRGRQAPPAYLRGGVDPSDQGGQRTLMLVGGAGERLGLRHADGWGGGRLTPGEFGRDRGRRVHQLAGGH
jgi:hypothetical protein